MKLARKKLLLAIIISAVLAGGSAVWFTRQVAEAAVITPPPPPSGLVGCWNFNLGIGGSIAVDTSGNGGNGTIYGATWTTGKFGQAPSFNGINSYVDLGDILRFETGDFSVEFWMKYFDGTYAIITKGWAFHGSNGWGIAVEGSQISVAMQGRVGTSSSPIPSGQWLHVTFTASRTGLGRIYLNGALDNSFDISSKSTILGTSDPLYIGRYINAMDFNGTIDEVRIYNRALSAAEIQADFQTSPGFSSQLLAKIPKGTTQVITTISWQGTGSINATITSPSQSYTEDIIPVYQKTTYSTTDANMLNIKRLSISVTALPADQSWTIALTFDSVAAYQIAVEVQK